MRLAIATIALLQLAAGFALGAEPTPADATADRSPAPLAKAPATVAKTVPRPVTVSLFNGVDLAGWTIDPASAPYHIEDGTLLIHGTGEGAAFKGETGSDDWDRYMVDVDWCVDAPTTPARIARGGFSANLQFLQRSTFIQFFDTGQVFTAWWNEKATDHFVHLSQDRLDQPPASATWHRYSILVDGAITPLFDGRAVMTVTSPGGSGGKVGLMIDMASDATVRLRHLTVTFLQPTLEQLRAARLIEEAPAKPSSEAAKGF